MIKTKRLVKCFYTALVDTINHDGIEHAGYLAFLALLGLFPFIVLCFSIAGFVGNSEIGLQFNELLLTNQLIPADIKLALKPRLDEISSGPPQGLLTISILGAIWTASSGLEGLRTILNRAYRVNTPPSYIWRRLLSIAQFLVLTSITIIISFLFIITPNLLQLIELLLKRPAMHLEQINLLRYSATAIILITVVATAYYIIPNIKQKFRSTVPGAVVVVLLWFAGGMLFAEYLNNFKQIATIYGSLGGIIASLLFFYIAAMILIFGAELNYQIEKLLGHKIIAKQSKESVVK